MNRKSFLRSLIGLLVAKPVVQAVEPQSTVVIDYAFGEPTPLITPIVQHLFYGRTDVDDAEDRDNLKSGLHQGDELLRALGWMREVETHGSDLNHRISVVHAASKDHFDCCGDMCRALPGSEMTHGCLNPGRVTAADKAWSSRLRSCMTKYGHYNLLKAGYAEAFMQKQLAESPADGIV